MMVDFTKDELDFLRGAIDAVLRGSGVQYAKIAVACDEKLTARLAAPPPRADEGGEAGNAAAPVA